MRAHRLPWGIVVQELGHLYKMQTITCSFNDCLVSVNLHYYFVLCPGWLWYLFTKLLSTVFSWVSHLQLTLTCPLVRKAQEAVGLRCPRSTLLLVNLSASIPGLFPHSCFPAGQLPACTGAWDYSFQGQDFALPFVGLHEVPVGPFLQSGEIPLNDNTSTLCISHSPQFDII